MTTPRYLEGFAEAIVGIPSVGTMVVPHPDRADTYGMLKLDYDGPRAWPYLYFHFAEGEHVFFSLN